MKQVRLTVEGGVVQNCETAPGVEVIVHDYDVEEEDTSDPRVQRDADGNLYKEIRWVGKDKPTSPPGAAELPIFRVEQYELHAWKYLVRARTAGEAVVKLREGGMDGVDVKSSDDGGEFLEPADLYGINAVTGEPTLAQEFTAAGGVIDNDFIPAIRSVEEATDVSMAAFEEME